MGPSLDPPLAMKLKDHCKRYMVMTVAYLSLIIWAGIFHAEP